MMGLTVEFDQCTKIQAKWNYFLPAFIRQSRVPADLLRSSGRFAEFEGFGAHDQRAVVGDVDEQADGDEAGEQR